MRSTSASLALSCVLLLLCAQGGRVAADCSGPDAFGDLYVVEQQAEGLTPKLVNGER